MKIIAYGSLLNQKSLEKTLQRSAQLTPIVVPNVQRIFNAPFGNYAFLNLSLANNCIIEAAYFELNESEVEKFGEREKGSEITEVKTGMHAFVWPGVYCQELPVLQSYIDVCTKGSRDLGIDLWRGMKTPRKVIDDSIDPKYP